MKTLMFGEFPESVRRSWGVPWSAAREREFRAMLALVSVGSRLVPERLRMIPEARAALAI
ncbi:hypothetical protein LRS71_00805 [Rhodococcus pyridinivorans]|uniref:hypothetical protein n=1 Tax=Rhodococcus pyridinivorans TaxID=103816 RepID=UPI001E5F4D5E|nr:hypothetical protein [Rhodococcus pyridinivorans]MCD5418121.1 hypothetical protein [Rhodococcus pyridinivorans]